MIPLSEFKKLAGKETQGFTDKELERFRDIMDQLAGYLFDMWIDNLKKNDDKNNKNN